MTPDHYAALRHAFDAAFKQAAEGKGAQRHANGRSFTDQPIFTIAESSGFGFLSGQAKKKIIETEQRIHRMLTDKVITPGEISAAKHELDGAMVYLAALTIHLQKLLDGTVHA